MTLSKFQQDWWETLTPDEQTQADLMVRQDLLGAFIALIPSSAGYGNFWQARGFDAERAKAFLCQELKLQGLLGNLDQSGNPAESLEVWVELDERCDRK
ncbi:MAG: hypothetical protein ACRCU2_06195 [Planktothrix sp.]